MSPSPNSVAASPLESRRFGLRVGRWLPEMDQSLPEMADFDIVIVRYPASWSGFAYDLVALDDFVAIHADTLAYWRWEDQGEPLPSRSGVSFEVTTDIGLIEELVRGCFVGYSNHYTANPLLDAVDALDGYVEWAQNLAMANPEGTLVMRFEGRVVGLMLIEWSAQPADIRLAGVLPWAQGKGWYAVLVAETFRRARARECAVVQSSTQVQNVAVQRIWSSLGFKLRSPIITTHLVRQNLL